MFTLRQILQKTYEFIDTHHLFIDFKQAYDSIRRDMLLSTMYALGIPAKLINMRRLTLADAKSLVKVDGEKSEPFIRTKGFRQGDGLSCDLFKICLELIIRVANIDTTGTILSLGSLDLLIKQLIIFYAQQMTWVCN